MADVQTLLSLQDLCAAIDGTVLAGNGGAFTSVATDSRQVVAGTMFVPLIGQEQDGHVYIPQSLKKGASVVLVSNATLFDYHALATEYSCVFILVTDTLHALQSAAAAYLDTFPKLIKIGVTGSSGKTTTKEILGSILSVHHDVIMNEGNLNSETGLPLSVFKVRSHHEIGIFEAGMNRVHELEELSAVLRPTYAVITNIGTAHIGILGSRDAIATEKRSIFSHFTADCRGFVYEKDDYKDFLKAATVGDIQTFGPTTTMGLARIEDKGLDGALLVFTAADGTEKNALLPLPGKYNALNACAAASVALAMGESIADVCDGISKVQPLFGRSQRIIAGGITFILDCYNANPDSMENALSFCDSVLWNGRKLYVIGSMLELGANEATEHEKLGRMLASSGADAVFMYGKAMEYAVSAVKESGKAYFYTCDAAELSARIQSECKKGDLVFLKGSRGCALEAAVNPLIQTLSQEEHRH